MLKKEECIEYFPVHKNSVNFVEPLASKGITSLWLFRQRANQKSKLPTTKGGTTIYNKANSEIVVLGELGEVKSLFKPETCFSGCLYRSEKGHDFSYFNTLLSFERLDLFYTNIKKDPSQIIPRVIGNNEFWHRSNAQGKIAHEAHSNVSPVLVESN